jgi:beta-lactamase class A
MRNCVTRVMAVALAVIVLGMPSVTRAGGSPGDAERAQSVERLITASRAEVAVAFRTLDGRDELFVDADRPFHAASTMKIPVMIELFRQADRGRVRLDDLVAVTNQFRSIVDGSPYQLSAADDSDPDVYHAVGKALTYRRLCEAMITVSSNLATNILIEQLGVDAIRTTVHLLNADGMVVRRGVEDNKAFRAGLNNTTTARALLTLLEAIAGERAVSPEASRAMIDILARQHFNDAIPGGLPPGTRVAHKTGNITGIHHDAAIVYGARPYVLVLLVRGMDDQRASADLIARITRTLHDSLARDDSR